MNYDKYKYIYPPRPENKISPENLSNFDTGEYLAQPKYNGSCCNIFLHGQEVLKVMNRHGQEMANTFVTEIDYAAINPTSGYMVVCGELLNKNKLGEDGMPFNKKFIIWDILVYDNDYMIGSTTADRLTLLESLFPCHRALVSVTGMEMYKHICCTQIKGVYKAPTYTNYFHALYSQLVKTDLYEGLVLKRADAKLAFGFGEKNNFEYTLKCRKETRNYTF